MKSPCLFRLLLAGTFSQTSLVSDDLDSSEKSWLGILQNLLGYVGCFSHV